MLTDLLSSAGSLFGGGGGGGLLGGGGSTDGPISSGATQGDLDFSSRDQFNFNPGGLNQSSGKGMPWWGWALIAAGIGLFLWLFFRK